MRDTTAPNTKQLENVTALKIDDYTVLDHSGARYRLSLFGRFMTPDWSASPEAVPYAALANPQSLNLYAYVQNNPVTEFDPDGHRCCFNWLGKFLGGVYSAVAGGAVDFVTHPIVSTRALANDALHPVQALRGGRKGLVTVTQQIASGDPRAIGLALGTVGVALGTDGVGAAGDALDGVEVAEAAIRVALPTEESQLAHIFREAEGHLPDTPGNRILLEKVANDPANSLGTAANGTTWSARTLSDGHQVWVQTRGGRIVNGGINDTTRTFNPSTGLSGGGGL